MTTAGPIRIIGGGAIGFTLAAYLAREGRDVIVVRASRDDLEPGEVVITIEDGRIRFAQPVRVVPVRAVSRLDGIIVVTTKAHANAAIAGVLSELGGNSPILILQNGIGVEKPFRTAGLTDLYRGVLYFTSQGSGTMEFTARAVAASPIGPAGGSPDRLAAIVAALSTDGFPFRVEPDITTEVWTKAALNVAFNSICPLLRVDNGVFARSARAGETAQAVLAECAAVMRRLGIAVDEADLVRRLLAISHASDGVEISTLQDIRLGRPTELEYLNAAVARAARELEPPVSVPLTDHLGRLTRLLAGEPG